MASTISPLPGICSSCRTLTFEMFWTGFKHPLNYVEQIESGRTCKLCKLIICSFSRLQVHASCYEVGRNYETYASLLPLRKSVLRRRNYANAKVLGFVMEKMVEPPLYLSWFRHGSYPGVCGSFGFKADDMVGTQPTTGATVQISAPEGSHSLQYFINHC